MTQTSTIAQSYRTSTNDAVHRQTTEMGADRFARVFRHSGGGSGAIRIPTQTESSALTVFHKHWPQIGPVAQDRYRRGEVTNGLVTLEIALFDSSFVSK